jgi:hypothetical protein
MLISRVTSEPHESSLGPVGLKGIWPNLTLTSGVFGKVEYMRFARLQFRSLLNWQSPNTFYFETPK